MSNEDLRIEAERITAHGSVIRNKYNVSLAHGIIRLLKEIERLTKELASKNKGD